MVRASVLSAATLAAVVLAACAAPGDRVPRDTVVRARPVPDSVVRNIVRVVRVPSGMQRVTPRINAVRALDPLDTAFVVRVLDSRGAELAGVPVRWTPLNPAAGAALAILNGVTDSSGLSRAVFTPGLTASPQGAAAEVENVGRIEFLVEVPARSIRVIVSPANPWSGEDVAARVELRDEAGNALVGGHMEWSTSDTSIIVIRSADSTTAVLRARRGGQASVMATAYPVRGSARLDVKPVLSVRFIGLDGKSVPPLRLEVRAGWQVADFTVTGGVTAGRVPFAASEQIDLRAQASDGSRAYHDVHLRLGTASELQDLVIVLIPVMWRIQGGTYDGRELPIDAASALRRTAGGAPFWRLVPTSGPAPRQLLGWPESLLPLRIAFDRAGSREQITGADSIAFWGFARQMERDLGAHVFAPVDMPQESTPGVVAVGAGSSTGAGHAFLAWNRRGDPYDADIGFRHAATLREQSVVTHELLHLLGFGHSGAWRTIATPSAGVESRLTPEDVAYVQVALRIRELQQRLGALPGAPLIQER